MEPDLSVAFDPQRFVARIRPALGDGTSTLIGLYVLTAFIRFGSNLIVSRLFAPEAYGAIGIIMSISYVLTMVSDLGLRAYVTRHPTAEAKLLQTVWTLRLIRNLVLAGVMFFGASGLAGLYSAPEIATGIRVAAALFLLDGLASLSLFTCERERRIIRLSVVEFVRTLFMTVVTIIAAYFLRTYWAVIISMFAASVYSIVASYRFLPGPPMRLRLNINEAADLWRFSRIIIPASIISIILTQTDKFFLANFFPLSELGKFMLASTIAVTMQGLIAQYVMRVSFPRIAQVMRENPDDAPKMFYSSRRRFMLVMAFCIGGVIGGGELVTQILFNDQYRGAGFYLSIVCLQPLFRLMTAPAQQALIAKGFIRAALTANLVRLAWVFAAGSIAFFQFGPLGVVVVMSLAEAATVPFFWWRQRRFDLFNIKDELMAYGAAGVGAALGLAAQTAAAALVAAGYLPAF